MTTNDTPAQVFGEGFKSDANGEPIEVGVGSAAYEASKQPPKVARHEPLTVMEKLVFGEDSRRDPRTGRPIELGSGAK